LVFGLIFIILRDVQAGETPTISAKTSNGSRLPADLRQRLVHSTTKATTG
jgi:hypothetical protein